LLKMLIIFLSLGSDRLRDVFNLILVKQEKIVKKKKDSLASKISICSSFAG